MLIHNYYGFITNMFYYNKTLPKEGDIVFVTLKNLSTVGTYCNLIEYNDIEGLILSTELDRYSRHDKRQIRISEQRHFTHGKIYCCLVISINQNNNNISIDLSYKKVDVEKREELVKKFEYVKSIKKLCDEFCTFSKLKEEVVYPFTIWKFTAEDNFDAENKYFDILRNPKLFCEHIPDEYKDLSDHFVENMKERITYTTMTVEQQFELIIFDVDAINKLKKVLEYNNENIIVECISSPKYKVSATEYSVDKCNEMINQYYLHLEQKTKEFRSIIKMLDRNGEGIVKRQDLYIRPLKLQQLN